MPLNSFPFLFLFLPVALFFFYLAGSSRFQLAIPWLAVISLIFYFLLGWVPTALLVGSIIMNYAFGMLLNDNSPNNRRRAKLILIFGIICNIGVLIFFKYFGIFGGTRPSAFTTDLHPNLIIPIALSFFTFQQIIYLVETWRGKLKDTKFLHHFLYIIFFPQLLIGRILRPSEFFPQL